ncbi:type II toxin-antitoxin system Phd/YefM family antitoxin [Conexibacter sp. CPCC 206217]|uniref:type II toxin-antitoxin system Phd/YefM family antitoxin n=1 Tax=Conexibacter sp. CPCC 206217 TaxID=3064574 RepID=UPI002725EE32|nr:type II toxin-antitoxin system Phd/YefM family antitoxin [Conexibacter sp. CPCC 206217]MDO8208901.1 type II toxin-antitoxin system Phd/YefM family antitoxin [Conexibacter sp. CPCC 206217]
MERIGVRELRQHATRHLARVKAGETVEVTERGRLIALLVPPDPETTARERLIAAGQIVPASRPFQLPEPLASPPGACETGAVLDELRADGA